MVDLMVSRDTLKMEHREVPKYRDNDFPTVICVPKQLKAGMDAKTLIRNTGHIHVP